MAEKSATAVYEGRDFYVPFFEILVKNQKLEKDVINDVISLTYKDGLADIDYFELSVNNWDAEKRKFKYIEGEKKETFYPCQDAEIWMGYYYKGKKQLQRMLFGEITSLEPNFPSSGSPTLNISGLNVLHRLRKKQRSDSYSKKRDSEIAKTIARRIGVDIEVRNKYMTAEEPHEFIFQNNMYDIVFLMGRAKTIGYELYVEEKKLHFHPSTKAKKAYALEWGRSLINFRPRLTTYNQVSEVVVTGWNPKAKKRVVGNATRKDLETKALGVEKDIKIIESSLAQKVEVIANQPVYTKQKAKETLEKMSKAMVKASGSTIGLPGIRAGTYLEINFKPGSHEKKDEEQKEIFSGRYFVTQTTHTINDSGYITNFSARKEEKK
jgi:phage protein D